MRATSLLRDGRGRVAGVAAEEVATGDWREVRGGETALATGGFANDRTGSSLLAAHRPDLLARPTTNGACDSIASHTAAS
jgi:succinate dehydrogenase/fumarate reductase flavoprotein subunit